jgi:hypothetical protein
VARLAQGRRPRCFPHAVAFHGVSRAQLLAGASQAALDRLLAAIKESDATTYAEKVFAPLGELVMWLCAFDDLLGNRTSGIYRAARNADHDGLVVLGIRFARNYVIHGDPIVEVTERIPAGGAYGTSAYGTGAYGGVAENYRWLARDRLPQLKVNKDLETSYDSNLAGQQVVPILSQGLAFLRRTAGV